MNNTIIIGAGAAGLMTAITAARRGLDVLVLDGQPKIGAKILMSGGTRCNVTNKTVTEKDYNSGQLLCVRNILRSFDNAKAVAFFKEIGVELVLEGVKFFPVTHSGKTVLEALINECKRLGVVVETGRKVTSLAHDGQCFTLKGQDFLYQAKQVVLTTGGLSYPTTGSDGTGFRLAQSFGHTVVTTFPALTPLKAKDDDLLKLSGIALPVELSLYAQAKKILSMRGDFLFTHFGFSGPVVLDMSRHWLAAPQTKLYVNFLPGKNEQGVDQDVQDTTAKNPKKTMKNYLNVFLPERLAVMILSKCGIDANSLLNQLSKDKRKALVKSLTQYPLETTGAVGYSKAEVTAGGVDLLEVNPKTLASNLQPGLFFAGEILDVDGRIGGFNFQWAWASGHAVGQALAQSRKEAEP